MSYYMNYQPSPWLIKSIPPFYPPLYGPFSLWNRGNQDYKIYLEEEDFPKRVTFLKKKYMTIKARDAYLCAGVLTAPNNGISYNSWGFLLEHEHSLSYQSKIFQLCSSARLWEQRIRTNFAERMAVGLAGYMMWKNYDIAHIADAGPFIKDSLNDPANPFYGKSLKSLSLYGKSGNYQPDFFCLDTNSNAVIVESKGAFGTPRSMKNAKEKGKQQTQNVSPTGISLRSQANRLVFASNFRYDDKNLKQMYDSTITIVDPEEGREAIPVELNPDQLILSSYSKFFNFLGLYGVSELLQSGMYKFLKDMFRYGEECCVNYQKVSYLKIWEGKDDQSFIGCSEKVIKQLFNGELHKLNRVLSEHKMESSEKHLIFPNGFAFVFGDRQ